MKHIINISEIEFKNSPVPLPENLKEKYEGTQMGMVGMMLGSQKLGYNVTVVPAGKRAFPLHNHHVNEEMFFVLEGSGEVRIGAETFPVKYGDFICCPPGGKELAHQIVNTSDAELRYLAVSTKQSPEIAEYPDSGKFGVLEGNFRFLGKEGESLGYYDGE
jgi:uncharacterized cupin superfamily protein